MSRRLRVRASFASVAVVGAMALLAPTPASAALTGPQQIAFLNAQRAAHGLPADVAEVPAWSAACAAHMAYLALPGRIFDHAEDPADPAYTAEGHWGGMHSVIVSAGDAFSASGVNAFERAPIHLSQMLSPFIARSGAGGGCLVTSGDIQPLGGGLPTTRAFATQQTFSYPGDGATAPTSEVSYEGPFVPAAAVGLGKPGDVTRSVTTGPSLYFFHAGPAGYWGSRGRITAATLTGPSGPLEVRTVDNATPAPEGQPVAPTVGTLLAPGGIVIPVAPLPNNATFSASVTFQPDVGDAVQRTWSFKTGTGGTGAPSTPPPSAKPAPGPATSHAACLETCDAALDALSPASASKLSLRRTSVRFTVPTAGPVQIRVEARIPRRGKKPARWATRRVDHVKAVAGANRVPIKRLAKGKHRVQISTIGTGRVLASKTVTF